VKSIDLTGLPLGDEIIVTKAYIKDIKQIEADLKMRAEEFWIGADLELKQKDIDHQKLIGEEDAKKIQAVKAADAIIQSTLDSVHAANKAHSERMIASKRAHDSLIRLVEAEFQSSLTSKTRELQDIAEYRQTLHSQWERDQNMFLQNKERDEEELVGYYNNLQAEADRQLELALTEQNLSQTAWKQVNQQIAKDFEAQLNEMKEEYGETLAAVKDDRHKLRGQAGVHKKSLSDIEDKISTKDAEIQSLRAAAAQEELAIETLDRKLQAQAATLNLQEKLISSKNASLQVLRGRGAELDKFKFVLTERIQELETQIGPKDEFLSKLKKQIRDMGEDLQACHQQGKGLTEHINQLKSKHSKMHRQLENLQRLISAKEGIVSDFKRTLSDIIGGDLQDGEELRVLSEKLLHRFNQIIALTSAVDSGSNQPPKLPYEQEQLAMEIEALSDDDLVQELLQGERLVSKRATEEDVVVGELGDQSRYLAKAFMHLRKKHDHDLKAETAALDAAVVYNSSLIRDIESKRMEISALEGEWHRLKALKSKLASKRVD
jgi:predicted  nucleic acid-binding Zn-ribbon protein